MNDHRRRRAWVTDVLLYDRLAIPVPDGEAEFDRWAEIGRDPTRQRRLLDILGGHAVRTPWNLELHEAWATSYGEISQRSGLARARVAEAVQFDVRNVEEARQREDLDSVAQYVTRMVLANGRDHATNVALLGALPRVEVESVPAYGSLHDLERNQAYRLDPSGRADGRPVLMFEHQVLVPTDSELSDEALLERAVKLADLDETKEYRAAFHAWRRDRILGGDSQTDSIADLERLAKLYRKASKASTFRVRARYGLGVFTALAGAIAVLIPPVGVAGIAAGIGTAVLAGPDGEIEEELKAGAFLHHSRRALTAA